MRQITRQHLLMDAARDHIARREVSPFRRVALHERNAVCIHQTRTRAAHRFRNQQIGCVEVVKCRWMKLDELHIDHPRLGALGHGHAVATRAGRVRRPQKDLPQPAGRQDRRARQTALDLPAGFFEQICANAGTPFIDRQAVERVVGGG